MGRQVLDKYQPTLEIIQNKIEKVYAKKRYYAFPIFKEQDFIFTKALFLNGIKFNIIIQQWTDIIILILFKPIRFESLIKKLMARKHFSIIPFCLLALLISLAATQSCCSQNTIQVTGQGTVTLKPDIATVTVGAEQRGKTTAEALNNLNIKINLIIAAIKRANIPTSDYSTLNLNLRSDYVYDNNTGQSRLVGQIASQQISVTLRGFDSNGTSIGRLIDSFSSINNITFNGVIFDKEDKNDANRQAEKAAFDDAKATAQQYAVLAGRQLVKVIIITDVSGTPYFAVYKQISNARVANVPTTVPVGNIQVSASVSTTWSIY